MRDDHDYRVTDCFRWTKVGAKELKHTENVYNALNCPEAGSLVTKVALEKLGFNLDDMVQAGIVMREEDYDPDSDSIWGWLSCSWCRRRLKRD